MRSEMMVALGVLSLWGSPVEAKPKAAALSADSLVAKAEDHVRGQTFSGEMEMEVKRDGSSRVLKMRIWSVGRDQAVVKILAPAKDRGTGNLRIGFNLWQYLPNADRVVKIPPSMMLQSWMGSDFSNDDLVRTSSLSRDYSHKIIAEEQLNGVNAVKIECLPKPDAPVVWGKVNLWVRASDAVPLKHEFYSEGGELLKVMEGSEIKTFGKHTVPTRLSMRTVKKADSTTLMTYRAVRFDEPIEPSIFKQEFLRKPPTE